MESFCTIQAIDFALNGYFDHTSPVWGTPTQMAASFGLKNYSGENITMSSAGAESIHGAFTTSTEHKKNYLLDRHTQGGVAIGIRGSVENFGK